MSEQYFLSTVCLTTSSIGSSQSTGIDWFNMNSRPQGPSNSPEGPVKPRFAIEAAYTARIPVHPGENPFHWETGSEWIQASDTLSAVAIEIAFAICDSESPK